MAFATAVVNTNPSPVTEEFIHRWHKAHSSAGKYYPGAFAGLNQTTGYFEKFDGTDANILFDGLIGQDFMQEIDDGTAAKARDIRIRQPRYMRVTTTTTITDADVGKPVYAAGHDDGRVQVATRTTGNLAPLGTIRFVHSSTEASVEVNIHTAPRANTAVYTPPTMRIGVHVSLSAIADGDIVTGLTPGFAGRIIGTEFVCTTKVTTASKSTVINAEIGTVNITGGLLTLNSAGLATAGTVVSGTAVTGANTFLPTDTISLEAASTTAFSEGAGMLNVLIQPINPNPVLRIGVHVNLSAIADGDVVTTITPGFKGQILGLEFVCTTKVTTASKATTLNAEIGTTNITGGTLALTSAGLAASGTVVGSAAPTGLNTFTAADTVSIEAASTTTFSEGAGMIYLLLQPLPA